MKDHRVAALGPSCHRNFDDDPCNVGMANKSHEGAHVINVDIKHCVLKR